MSPRLRLQRARPDGRGTFRRAIDKTPTFADAFYNLGILDAQDGKPESAAVHFTAAARYRPMWPLPYLHLGALLAQRGEPAAAADMYNNARSLAAKVGQRHLVQEIDAKIAALSRTEWL